MKRKINQNYLEKIPAISQKTAWKQDENNLVTLEIENRGIANLIAQKLLKKPKISYIHLDEFGSFVWLQIDGKRDIFAIGKNVRNHFGDKAEPLYERLAYFIKNLEFYKFIYFN